MFKQVKGIWIPRSWELVSRNKTHPQYAVLSEYNRKSNRTRFSPGYILDMPWGPVLGRFGQWHETLDEAKWESKYSAERIPPMMIQVGRTRAATYYSRHGEVIKEPKKYNKTQEHIYPIASLGRTLRHSDLVARQQGYNPDTLKHARTQFPGVSDSVALQLFKAHKRLA